MTTMKQTVGNYDIAYDIDSSRAENGDEQLPRVVQLHGLTSSRARDTKLGLNFVGQLSGVEALRYDAPGHGESHPHSGYVPKQDDFLWGSLAETLVGLLSDVWPDVTKPKSERDRPLIGVGQSMGCATLLTAAAKNPNLFDKLILSLPPTLWEYRAKRAQTYEISAEYVENHGLKAYSEWTRREPLPPAVDPHRPHTDPDVDEALLPTIYRGASHANLVPREMIEAISCPIAIFAWTEDPGHPMASAKELCHLLPQARLYVATTPNHVQAWPDIMNTFIHE